MCWPNFDGVVSAPSLLVRMKTRLALATVLIDLLPFASKYTNFPLSLSLNIYLRKMGINPTFIKCDET